MTRRLFAAVILSVQTAVAQSPQLLPGATTGGTLAGGERTSYTIAVPAGFAAKVVVRQEGVDVSLAVGRPGQVVVNRGLNFTAGLEGEELALLPVADADATWEIVVSAALPKAVRGRFTLALDAAPADDKARAAAGARTDYQHASDVAWGGDAVSFGKALDEYLAVSARARAAGDTSLEAESLYQAARVQDSLGDYPQATESQKRALELFRALGRRDREARALNRLGDLARKVGELDAAEQYFELALPLARASRDPVNVADVLNNSGLLLTVLGRPEEAIAQLQDAVPLAQEVDSANVEAALHFNVGDAYLTLGVHDKALAAFERALAVGRRLNLPRRTARHYMAIGTTSFELGDRAKAEESLVQALELYALSGDRSGEAEAQAAYGRMLHALGEDDRAVALFAQARPQLRAVSLRSAETRLLTAWAEVEVGRDRLDSALQKLDEASELARVVSDPRLIERVQYVRARALQKQGNLRAAAAAIADTTRSIEATRETLRRQELRTSYLARVREYFDLHVELLQQQGESAAAFEMSERGRARTLLDALADSSRLIRKGIDPALMKRERALHAQINAREAYRAQLAAKFGEESRQAASVAADVGRLLDRLKELQAEIRGSSPAYWALRKPEPVRLAQVQHSLLDADSALVEYRLGPRSSQAWVVDRAGISAYTLPAAKDIDVCARRYHELLSREIGPLNEVERARLQRELTAAGARLADTVWKPIAARVRHKRLVIVADGVLLYVPFAALPGADGRPLIVSHEIVNLPSASVLESLRQRGGMRVGTSVAVFADPVFSNTDPRLVGGKESGTPQAARASDGQLYARLRFSRSEADAIGALAPSAFKALDFVAAKETLVKGDLKKYGILHFATHGVLNSANPELSGLVLSLVDRKGQSVDGFLRLHEVYNLDLDADLVVLSACRTALGQEVYGEGLIGLTRGFMYAGASRVVSSIWNVDDRASARLMSLFYTSILSKRRSPAASLRDAQLALLNDPRWSHPHYWAAFSLQGDGQ